MKINFRFLSSLVPYFVAEFFLVFFGFFYGLFMCPRGIDLKPIIQNRKSLNCYILATGPSINDFDIAKLAGKDCFTLSNFYLHKDINLINPIAHFVASYHKPLQKNNFIDWIKDIHSKLPIRTILVTDIRNKKLFEKAKINSRKIIYVPTFPLNGIFYLNRFGSQMRPWSIPILAIPILFLAGYKKLNLLGCDHTTLKNYKQNIKNFYPNNLDIRKRTTDQTHWNKLNIITALQNELLLFKQYYSLSSFLKKKNVKILNLSNDSWLDFL